MKFGICLPIRLDADDLKEIFYMMEAVSKKIMPVFGD